MSIVSARVRSVRPRPGHRQYSGSTLGSTNGGVLCPSPLWQDALFVPYDEPALRRIYPREEAGGNLSLSNYTCLRLVKLTAPAKKVFVSQIP